MRGQRLALIWMATGILSILLLKTVHYIARIDNGEFMASKVQQKDYNTQIAYYHSQQLDRNYWSYFHASLKNCDEDDDSPCTQQQQQDENEVNLVNYDLAFFLVAWTIAIIVFTALTVFCVRCFDRFEDSFNRIRRRRIQSMRRDSLVSKKVVDRTAKNLKCDDSVRNWVPNRLNDDRIDPLDQSDPKQTVKVESKQCVSKKIDASKGEKHCSICLETFKVGDCVSWSKKLVPCSHVFHTECITKWLSKKADCPCCRRPFFTEDDYEIRPQRCCNFMKACRLRNKAKKNEIKEIDDDTDEEVIFEYRAGAEFCLAHGLIFPNGYVILGKSDEKINQV